MKPDFDTTGGRRGVPIDTLTADAPIVVLAPHPDDESLACGGLLAGAFAADGAHVVCLTDGGASHPAKPERPRAALAALRRDELIAAIGHLGGSRHDLTWLGLRDGEVSQDPAHHPQIIARIAHLCETLGARTLFATASADAHGDHKAAAAIATAVRNMSPRLRLIWYPVWSRWDDPASLEAAGQRVMTLETHAWRDAKAAAIAAHASQHDQPIAASGPVEPTGFALDPDFIQLFLEGDEIFWEAFR